MEILMAMFGAGFDLALVILALIGVYLLYRATCGVRVYFLYREPRRVICPETRQPTLVKVAARCAGVQAIWDKRSLRLSDCSRWPARGACPQDCLRQIEAAPAELKISASYRAS